MEGQDLVDLAHPADAETREELVLAVDRLFEVLAEEISDRLAAERTRFVGRINLRTAVDARERHELERLIIS